MANTKIRPWASKPQASNGPTRSRNWRNVFSAQSDQSDGGVRLDAGGSEAEDGSVKNTPEPESESGSDEGGGDDTVRIAGEMGNALHLGHNSESPANVNGLALGGSAVASPPARTEQPGRGAVAQLTAEFTSSSSSADDSTIAERLENMCLEDYSFTTDSNSSQCFDESAENKMQSEASSFSAYSDKRLAPQAVASKMHSGQAQSFINQSTVRAPAPQASVHMKSESSDRLKIRPDGSILNTDTGEVYTLAKSMAPVPPNNTRAQTPERGHIEQPLSQLKTPNHQRDSQTSHNTPISRSLGLPLAGNANGAYSRRVQASPTRQIPRGYRGGLTGSVSDGKLAMISSLPAVGDAAYGQQGASLCTMGRSWAPLPGAIVPKSTENSVVGQHNVPAPSSTPTSQVLAFDSPMEDVPVQYPIDYGTLPFVELAKLSEPSDFSVVHLSNIPFNSSRAEIVAFFGRNSRIANDDLEPVHIIMDRISSKTNDAYVEFCTDKDAVDAVDKIKRVAERGRPARIGERQVAAEVVSKVKMMEDLFPIAKGVDWSGPRAVIVDRDSQDPWEKFKTFVTAEEMTMLVKHVEVPTRSPYAKDCPERPFECFISTIKKMPWYMTDRITVHQRHTIFEACVKLIELLKRAISQGRHDGRLTSQLLERLVKAAMLCPGFTVVQKDGVASLAGMGAEDMRRFHQPPFADHWRHQYAIGPRPGSSPDELDRYIALIREETERELEKMDLAPEQQQQVLYAASQTSNYWGLFWLLVDYHQLQGSDFDNMTLAEAAEREWSVIDYCLSNAAARKTAEDQLMLH